MLKYLITLLILFSIANAVEKKVTVKPSGQGGDYTTIDAAIDDNLSDLTAGVGTTFVVSVEGTWSSDDVAAVTLASGDWTTSKDYFITIEAIDDALHEGAWSSSYYQLDVASGQALVVDVPHTVIRGLQIEGDECLNMGGGVGPDSILIENCIFNEAVFWAVFLEDNCDSIVVRNCLFISPGRAAIGMTNSASVRAMNCTAYDVNASNYANSGFFRQVFNTTAQAINCICFSNASNTYFDFDDAATAMAGSGYNLSGDGSANVWSSNGQDSETDTDVMNNPSGGDFTLKDGSAAINNGVLLSLQFTDDIIGTTRGPGWDIGAFEVAQGEFFEGGPTAFGAGNPGDPDGRAVDLGNAPSLKVASRFYNTYAGTLDSISVGLSDSGDPDSVYFFIYSDNAGEPNTLLATSVDSAVVNTADENETIFTLDLSTSLAEDTYYWLGFGNSAGSDINFSYLSSAAGGARQYTDLRPYDVSWNTGGDASPGTELLAIAYITPDDSIRHLWPTDGAGNWDEFSPIQDDNFEVADPGKHDSIGTFQTINSSNKTHSYLLPDWSDVGGNAGDVIDSVLVIGVIKRANDDDTYTIAPFIYNDPDSLHGTPLDRVDFTESFADTAILQVFTTAPDGGSWTVTDVDNLEIGIRVASVGFLGGFQVTQYHARVYYEPAEVVAGEGQFIMVMDQ